MNGSHAGDHGYSQSESAAVLAGLALPIPIGVLSTTLRFWSELYLHGNRLAADDYLMLWATVVSTTACALGLHGARTDPVRGGLAAPGNTSGRLILYLIFHVYLVATAATKLSVLALYYRAVASRTVRIASAVTAVICLLWQLGCHMALGLYCRPTRRFWDWSQPGHCGKFDTVTLATTISNVVLDVWICVLPLPLVLRMQLPCRRKALLAALFSLGLGVCGIAIYRLVLVISPKSPLETTQATIITLSVWEPTGCILCANLPIIYKSLTIPFRWIGLAPSSDAPSAPWRIPQSWYGRHVSARKRARYEQAQEDPDQFWASTQETGVVGEPGSPAEGSGGIAVTKSVDQHVSNVELSSIDHLAESSGHSRSSHAFRSR